MPHFFAEAKVRKLSVCESGLAGIAALLALASWCAPSAHAAPERETKGSSCPAEMVSVRSFCVDRWEASMVDRSTGQPLSPYYPPNPRLLAEVWQAWELDRSAFGSD